MDLITEPILIGRSGYTVDNRLITEKDISDITTLYDPKKQYQAKVNFEHTGWSQGWGKVVDAEQRELDDGDFGVYARLKIGANLIDYSQYNDGIFFSMEITRDYRKTGQTYMYALAATTDPACCGLDEVKFSKNKLDPENERSKFIESQLKFSSENEEVLKAKFKTSKIPDELLKASSEDSDEESKFVNKVSKALFSLFKKDQKNTDEEPMTPEEKEQFQALSDKVDKLVELSSKDKQEPEQEPETKDKSGQGSDEKLNSILDKLDDFKKTTVSKEDFEKVVEEVAELKKYSNTLLGVDLTELEGGENSFPGY